MHSFSSLSLGIVALALYIASNRAMPVTSPLDAATLSVTREKTPDKEDQTTKDLNSRAQCVEPGGT